MKRTSKQVADLVRSIQYPATVADPEAARIIAQLRECVMNLAEQVAAQDAKLDPSDDDVDIQAGENVTVDKVGPRAFRISATDEANVTNIGGGVYKAGGSIKLGGDTFSLDGDETTPAANKVYGTNASAVRGWHDAPSSLPNGTNTGDILYWNQTTSTWVVLARPSGTNVVAVLTYYNSLPRWVTLANNYQVPQRSGTTVIGDYVRFNTA